MELQAKLLRVLQDGQFERLGSTTTIKVDVRVIAATNRELAKEVEKKKFREDLYYRLKVFPINVPPLRERIEDIPALAHKFVDEFSESMGKKVDSISGSTMEMLKSYSWPGNVRELKNVIEHSMILHRGQRLDINLPEHSEEGLPDGNSAKVKMGLHASASDITLREMERHYIQQILKKTRWVIEGPSGAAKIADLKPSTLRYRMKILGIQRPVV